MRYNERRHIHRYARNLPIQISMGTQIVLNKTLRDISEKSAYVHMTDSVYLDRFDVLDFKIEVTLDQGEFHIEGKAQVLRFDPSEGMVIAFKDLEEDAAAQLHDLVATLKGNYNK